MSLYFPIIQGDTGLRAEVEGLLDGGDHLKVERRISELDNATEQLGKVASFGLEIEFQFINDGLGRETSSSLYDELVKRLNGPDRIPGFALPLKGEVVRNKNSTDKIMGNENWAPYPDSDDANSSMIEARTWPYRANKATNLYWEILGAIGDIAQEHGILAMIHSTHLSASVYNQLSEAGSGFTNFATNNFNGHDILAVTQQNLVSLQPLQIDSGVEEGLCILEAFPGKSSTTGVHANRLEFRHPIIGVIDPRIDILAVLDALFVVSSGESIDSARAKMRRGQQIAVLKTLDSGRTARMPALEVLTMMDYQTRRLCVPAHIDVSSIGSNLEGIINTNLAQITGRSEVSVALDNGRLLREIASKVYIDPQGNMQIDDSVHIQGAAMSSYIASLLRHSVRILPDIRLDSPSAHEYRRRHLLKSSVVRRILGNACAVLTPVTDSVAQRQALIDRHMIVLPD